LNGERDIDETVSGYGQPGPCNIRVITPDQGKHNMDLALEEYKDPSDTVHKYVKLSDKYTELKNKKERMSLSLSEWNYLHQWLLLLKY
jgi:hypothetical protein